ncbi:PVC-type heme-binding CxxCH protein [Thalassoglobus polymorphus]|uniref:GDSL-like Lipase/Acylhydrolase n=1 Tax=Thalassoglobus polymorphus TaxID=2527994 RepID=A0A517QV57_9PLAN|nr:PVC-type heme-binding CxxCH protein [Thalassoglobus polymorphus]QDT35503.1 GDSL-like Lipase/Acylhydrolase [Thalassoglobus polymorphus]
MISGIQRSVLALLVFFSSIQVLMAQGVIAPNEGDKVVILGNTLAERMQYFNHWETLLHHRFPEKKLVVRNLGWSADAIDTRLRSQDFQDHGHTLVDHQPNLILAMFGYNESFAGEAGIPEFEEKLSKFVDEIKALKYPSQSFKRGSYEPQIQDKEGAPKHDVRVVLISPIASEDLPNRGITAGTDNNTNLELYTAAMQRVAKAKGVPFVDLFAPTKKLYEETKKPLTMNGIHLNFRGYRELAKILDGKLFGDAKASDVKLGQLRKEVAEKNLQFFYDYRAVNGFYIYGGRKKPFGVVNFPAEFEKLRKMIAVRDKRIWKVASGESVPKEIDDSGTGEFTEIQTNFKNEVYITPPDEALESFTLPEGFEINLWASEKDFKNLENPVQFTFDGKGRLFVTTMPSYPMYLPGVPVDDKILILEDTNGDGKADTEKVFAKGLHLPTGIELANGGAYVAQQPNLMFIKDTDGDDVADVYQHRLHGFDSADSHHSLSAFELGPGGELYFQEGTFHHTQFETPQGPERVANAAVFRYEPRSEKLDVFVSYNFANPWGHCFDKWGQNFVADASGGANYVGAAFSGDLDHPRKHPGLKQFLVKQWRPTCGCEIVSSRNFPKEMQGNYLLNNCIGFQGVLQYRFEDDGLGFAAEPVEPLLRSSDPNFRPVDLQFGPDGALYVLDWFNPLVGHMQHNLRDPNRDKVHGRIWRITYKDNPLVEPTKTALQSTEELLTTLKTYEDRTRFQARRELGSRKKKEVIPAVDKAISEIKTDSEADQHLLLELLWVKQHHDAVDVELLDRILASKDARARAAAVRVLCYWRDRIDEPLAKIQTAIHDENPRVRLEAVRALSFFDSQQALDIAVESLIYDQDVYLEYALKETMETLQNRIDANAKAVSQTDSN